MAQGAVVKEFNEVAKNSIWREHCKKESKVSRLNTNFSIPNPQRMTILPEKPNNTLPYTIRPHSERYMQATSTLEKLCNTKDTHKIRPLHSYEVKHTLQNQHTQSSAKIRYNNSLHTTLTGFYWVQLPSQIHVLPVTSNQAYGFQYEPLVKPDPMFAYNHQKCDVTAYAETYCSSMNGQSPFAKAEGSAPAVAK